MSSAGVRAALQTFLATPGITGLERVYLAEPWFASGEEWKLSTNSGWGAIGWVHLSETSESRITLPALTGQKQVVHRVGIVLLFQYLIPAQLPNGAAEDVYVTYLDELTDNVVARLRSDPTAGTGAGGAIFQQSQDPEDCKIVRDLPKRKGGKIISWQLVETTAVEIVTA